MSSMQVDAKTTVRIRSRRFEMSPFHDFYSNAETVLGVYAGRFYAVFNGDDPVERYWALRRKAVLYDVPERPVQIEGSDVVPFLERIFSRKISHVKEGRGRYAIACTPQGGVFMDGILFRLGETRFWYVQPDGALESWLVAHSAGFDVRISDPHSRVLQIQGPNSPAIMSAASKGSTDGMGYFHSGFLRIGDQDVYVSRTGWTGELGYEIYTQGSATDCKRLWDHLMTCGESYGLVFGSIASMGIRRIEAGILDNGTDMDPSMTPFQAGLGAFVDLDKEGFVGREALLKADAKPLLYGLRCEAAAPDRGNDVLLGDQIVGRVTTGAWSPYLKCGIGYSRFTRPAEWTGQSLSLRSANGMTFPCRIVDLPFYDSEKRIPRGLDTSTSGSPDHIR